MTLFVHINIVRNTSEFVWHVQDHAVKERSNMRNPTFDSCSELSSQIYSTISTVSIDNVHFSLNQV